MINNTLTKSATGSIYSIVVSSITIVLGFTRSVILMRLLDVELFGTIALALFYSTIILPLTIFGLDHALIQYKNPSDRSFSTHFTLRILFSALALLIGWLFSPLLRSFIGEQFINIILALIFANFLDSTSATHFVILRREMRFGVLAVINLCTSLAMTIFVPLLAYLGAGVWSLVGEHIISAMVRWISVWVVVRPWRFQFNLDRGEMHKQLTFGYQVLLSNLLSILLDRFDDFWTGTALGKTALGFYSKAYEISQYPERVLSAPITMVFMSSYANLQEKRLELSQAFFRSSCFLIRVGLLINAVLLIVTPEFVSLLFTEKWLPIVPIFRYMLVYIFLDPLYINLSSLMVGVGHPRLLTRVRLTQTTLFIILVILFAYLWGTNGVAIATNVMMFEGTLALIISSRKFVDYSISKMFLVPVISVIIAISVGILIDQVLQIRSLLGLLLIKSVLVGSVYILVLTIFEYQNIRRFGFASIKPIISQIRTYLTGIDPDRQL